MTPTPKPFWMPDTQGFLAIAIILLIAVIVVLLMVKPITLDDKVSGMLTMLIGVLVACLKDVYAFFFGSSKGSEKKDDALISGAVAAAPTTPVAPVALKPEPAKGGSLAGNVVGALGVGIVLASMLWFDTPANAQINLLPKPKAAVAAPAPATGLAKFINDIESVKAELIADVIADINAADADASATDPETGKMRDLISHTCYPAEIRFLQSLPAARPLTGKFTAVQLFQKKRDFVLLIQAGLPDYLKIGCAPLLGDEASIFAKSLALVGVHAALNALVPGGGVLAGLTF